MKWLNDRCMITLPYFGFATYASVVLKHGKACSVVLQKRTESSFVILFDRKFFIRST